MITGLACYVRGCTEAVVGQCGGYKENCGQFYCRMHSNSKLCVQCFTRKAADEAAARHQAERRRQEAEEQAELVRLYQDYSKEAQAIKEKVPLYSCGFTFLLFIFGVGVFYAAAFSTANFRDQRQAPAFTIGVTVLYGIGAIIVWILSIKAGERKRRALALQLDAEKPGFSKFYKAWDEADAEAGAQRGREELKRVLVISSAIGGAAIRATNEYRRQRAHDD